ncbi:MAG: carbohydrate-binding family 9-like protein [Chitinophagia bacterium]|jgi:hypothetical protein
MKKITPLLFAIFTMQLAFASSNTFPDTLKVKKTADFEIDGKGTNANWNLTNWVPLTQLDSGVSGYDTKFKTIYSDAGIYVFFTGNDKKITSEYYNDFENLFKADVFEVFFHPEPKTPIYLEYEVNAHNAELVLLIPNLKNKINGWIPWHYTANKKVTKKVFVHEENNQMYKWSAELFFPYSIFSPLENTDIKKGTCWNANFYRLDYDSGKMIKWSWSPVIASFHEFNRFGVIQFD